MSPYRRDMIVIAIRGAIIILGLLVVATIFALL